MTPDHKITVQYRESILSTMNQDGEEAAVRFVAKREDCDLPTAGDCLVRWGILEANPFAQKTHDEDEDPNLDDDDISEGDVDNTTGDSDVKECPGCEKCEDTQENRKRKADSLVSFFKELYTGLVVNVTTEMPVKELDEISSMLANKMHKESEVLEIKTDGLPYPDIKAAILAKREDSKKKKE